MIERYKQRTTLEALNIARTAFSVAQSDHSRSRGREAIRKTHGLLEAARRAYFLAVDVHTEIINRPEAPKFTGPFTACRCTDPQNCETCNGYDDRGCASDLPATDVFPIVRCGGYGLGNTACKTPRHTATWHGVYSMHWICETCGGRGRDTWD